MHRPPHAVIPTGASSPPVIPTGASVSNDPLLKKIPIQLLQLISLVRGATDVVVDHVLRQLLAVDQYNLSFIFRAWSAMVFL